MFCIVLSLTFIMYCLLLSSLAQTEHREIYSGERKNIQKVGMGRAMWEEDGSREKDDAVRRRWRARFEPDKRLKKKRWRACSNQDETGEESWELWGGGWRRLSLSLWGERQNVQKGGQNKQNLSDAVMSPCNSGNWQMEGNHLQIHERELLKSHRIPPV